MFIFVGNAILLMANIPVSCFLQNYLDPVYRMKLSVRTFPFLLFKPNWPFSKKMLPYVIKFVKKPSSPSLKQIDDELEEDCGYTLFYWAVREGSTYLICQLMTKAHAQVTKKIWCEACKQGRLEVVKILISMTSTPSPTTSPTTTRRSRRNPSHNHRRRP